MNDHGLRGREDTLELLSAAVHGLVEGQGDAVLLLAERGLGRSACLAAVDQLARLVRAQVLDTGGSTAESDLSFSGLHRLLRPLVPVMTVLPPVQRSALLTALGIEDGPFPEPFLVSTAALSLLSAASARRPVVLCVDDLQWLDEASRLVLDFLARRVDRQRVLLVATAADPTGSWLSAGAFREIRLDRLDAVQSRRVARDLAPDLDEGRCSWVLERAVGNPLALVELTSVAQSMPVLGPEPYFVPVPLTPALDRAFGAAVPSLRGQARDALLVAALASADSTQEVVSATAALSGRVASAEVLDSAVALGLLRYDDARVRFTHPLIRSAVAQHASATERQDAHRALGRTVTLSARRRTWHQAQGTVGYDDAVAAELEAQGRRCGERGDAGPAELALERAAELSSRPGERGHRLLLAAEQAAIAGRSAEFRRLHAAAVAGELSVLDSARADLLGGDGPDSPGQADRVMRQCRSAVMALDTGDRDLALELGLSAARGCFSAPQPAPVHTAASSVVERLLASGYESRAIAALGLVDPQGSAARVLGALEELESRSQLTSPSDRYAQGVAARVVGDCARASRILEMAETDLTERRLHGTLGRVLCLAADVRLDLGLWQRAQGDLASVQALTGDPSSHLPHGAALVTVAKAAALAGDGARALDLLAEAERGRAARSGASLLARGQIVRGLACLVQGHHEEAVALLRRVFDTDDPVHHEREAWGAVAYLTEAATRCGQSGVAQTVVSELAGLARRCPSPLLATQLQYSRALLTDDDTTEQLFLDALGSELATWPWPRARLQLAFGRWLRRHRQVVRSRGPLEDARAALQQLGAVTWEREAVDELEATGLREGARDPRGPSGLLSTQEFKIARLAAEGLSNVEIGQLLSLSPRTVGSHLYRIFPKLDISARGQLSVRLAAQAVRSPTPRAAVDVAS